MQNQRLMFIKKINITSDLLVAGLTKFFIYARQFVVLFILTVLLFTTSITISVKNSGASVHKYHYTFGVFPHMPPRELDKIYGSIAAEISRVTDSKVRFKSSSTFEKFMEHLDAQMFDIAFVQPFDYVRIADNYGYKPLATRAELLTTVFVVKHDSPINGIDELKGKKLGFPPAVAAVTYLGKAYLLDQEIDLNTDVSISHFKSHLSCLQQVVIGLVDVCGTAAVMIRYFQHRLNKKFKVIGESSAIPHALFTVHPRVPAQDRKIILDVILSWSKTDKAKGLLEGKKLSPFSPINDKAYDPVREFIRTLGN